MAEVVMSNQSTKRMNGDSMTPLEKAAFLVKNNYPVPTTDIDALAELIEAKEKKAKEEAAPSLPERTFDAKSNDPASKT